MKMFDKLKVRILGWLWDRSSTLKAIALEDDDLWEEFEEKMCDDPEHLRDLLYG